MRESRASHELRRSESEKAKLEELSNNISERRRELKANEPVRERSERKSGYIVGYIRTEPSGELLVYPQYSLLLAKIDKNYRDSMFQLSEMG